MAQITACKTWHHPRDDKITDKKEIAPDFDQMPLRYIEPDRFKKDSSFKISLQGRKSFPLNSSSFSEILEAALYDIHTTGS